VSETRAPTPATDRFLDDLNPAQLDAVTHRGGHCLVLAGAGSGKTRVLTHRIAWLIAEREVDPAAICALTFTNKAAAEMRRRVRRLLDDREVGEALWLSTFHSLGLRLLREWTAAGAGARRPGAVARGVPVQPGGAPTAATAAAWAPGEAGSGDGPIMAGAPVAAEAASGGRSIAEAGPWLPPLGFAVYDRDASLAVWRRAQAAVRISPRDYDPARLFNACSRAVNRLEDPASWEDKRQSWERRITARIWKRYRAAMRDAGAVDFDDLMHLPLQALARDAELRRRTAGRFAHLLIDEYQDTNRIQYRLVKTLLAEGTRLMVVGDEDQAIYRWRGADLNNVLDFQSDFPGATVVRLEQNYRSSQPILSAAGSLVANNRQRLGKQLWTERAGGELPLFVQCATDREEAEWVAKKIEELAGGDGGGMPTTTSGTESSTVAPPADAPPPALSEIAVLYRTNAQSRLFEEVFIGRRIPHRVVGGQRFFARREVRDVLAYLQLLVRDDDVALQRAISAPSRGIGPRTLEALAGLDAHRSAAATLRALAASDDPERAFRDAGFAPAVAARLLAFGRLLAGLRELAAASSVAELIRITIERSGYAQLLEREENTEDRLANLGELVAAAQEATDGDADYAPEPDSVHAGEGDEKPRVEDGSVASPDSASIDSGLGSLRAFLDRLALLADADTDRPDADGVRLMTVHAAKGLEFDVVFLAGMEEELFPHATAIAEGDVEEERRLCYVGMTRARRRLLLSAARSRRINGRERWLEPSRFIGEIDPRQIEVRDYLSPSAVGSKDWAPSAFTGIGGRSGQRQRSRRSGQRQKGRSGQRPKGQSGLHGARGRGSPSPRRGTSTHTAEAPVKLPPGQPTRPAAEPDLVEGATVLHPMFGPGRVVETTGSGDKLKLEIRFNKAGTKSVIARFAKLQVPE
jgi:DNA helicase-2/ATP-dependent DNA helicase PcrA